MIQFPGLKGGRGGRRGQDVQKAVRTSLNQTVGRGLAGEEAHRWVHMLDQQSKPLDMGDVLRLHLPEKQVGEREGKRGAQAIFQQLGRLSTCASSSRSSYDESSNALLVARRERPGTIETTESGFRHTFPRSQERSRSTIEMRRRRVELSKPSALSWSWSKSTLSAMRRWIRRVGSGD